MWNAAVCSAPMMLVPFPALEKWFLDTGGLPTFADDQAVDLITVPEEGKIMLVVSHFDFPTCRPASLSSFPLEKS